MPKLKYLFKKNKDYIELKQKDETGNSSSPSVPEGLFVKCPECNEPVYKGDIVENNYTCPKCGGYFRIKAKTRIRMLVDAHSFKEWFMGIDTPNPLDYPDYRDKLQQLKEKTHLDEAIRIGEATIGGIRVVIGVMDARFLMGSMGYVVGEKISRSFEEATKLKLPVVLYCCSGGARMQEGITSLMQMAKTSAAIQKHSEAGLFYLSVLTDPTMGGVTASFAMLGDVIIAEPGVLIGFAGPRVIAQTIGQKLPEGFQRAEFLLDHGMIDAVVSRKEQKTYIQKLIKMHCTPIREETEKIKRGLDYIPREDKTPWERVELARSNNRPTSLDYIESIFKEFTQLHGDRNFRDDGAVVGGIAYLEDTPVTVIGIQKGRNTKENIIRNFGMPSPEGYRKGLRLMKQAEKFHRPIINFVDTPGAFCGIEAEERGQGEAIARNLLEMSSLKVPVLSIVIGEGGSGGALALAVGNEVWMMENATYSILSPEGFASILWKDGKMAEKAAKIMKITAKDLYDLQIIERVIQEPNPITIGNMEGITKDMKGHMLGFLKKYQGKRQEEIATLRYDRFRRM